jgi:integrase
MSKLPNAPWVPIRFVVNPIGPAKYTQRGGQRVRCWDVRGAADGRQFFRRFTAPLETAEMAKRWAKSLIVDYSNGLLWDPKARCFIEAPKEPLPSVYDWCTEYWAGRVHEWEPASRVWAATSLSRACLFLLKPGAPTPDRSVEDFVKRSFSVSPPERDDTSAQWIRSWSMDLVAVDHNHLKDLLEKHRARPGGGTIAVSTERRFRADLQACWRVAVGRRLIPTNPWAAVDRRSKRKQDGRVEIDKGGVKPVNPDVVLSPAQVLHLAECVAQTTPTAGRYRMFLAIMGFCGVRPSEACGLLIGDVELPVEGDNGVGWLTVRRSQRSVATRWVAAEEDPIYGPLKGRTSDTARRVPIPTLLVPMLRQHLECYRSGAAAAELVFTAVEGGRIDLSRFSRQYWLRGRDAAFGDDPVLKSIRRHDLRHSACSLWLNSGVPLKLATTWSGHESLKVFLDVYQGIMPGSEDVAVEGLEALIRRLLGPES